MLFSDNPSCKDTGSLYKCKSSSCVSVVSSVTNLRRRDYALLVARSIGDVSPVFDFAPGEKWELFVAVFVCVCVCVFVHSFFVNNFGPNEPIITNEVSLESSSRAFYLMSEGPWRNFHFRYTYSKSKKWPNFSGCSTFTQKPYKRRT